MARGAWQPCPECGKNCLGYEALAKHKATHPGLQAREEVAFIKEELAREEKWLEEIKQLRLALTFPLPQKASELIERRINILRHGHQEGQSAEESLQEYIDLNKEQLAQVEAHQG